MTSARASVIESYDLLEAEAKALATAYCTQEGLPYYHIRVMGISQSEITFKRCFGSAFRQEQIHCISFPE